jgi:putative oxidoreductase
MKTASTIARRLAGVIFLVFGLNGFLHFIPLPPPSGVAGQFMGALFVSHYLTLIFALQVIQVSSSRLAVTSRIMPQVMPCSVPANTARMRSF